ncbi:MAG: Bax inhibitor-1 family protein [Polyangiales bacterium]
MQEYSYAPSRTATGDRSTFIVKTYLHLLGAIMAFVALEVFIFASGLALPLAQAMMGVSWLLVLGAFMVVSWLGSRIAITAESKIAQYAALGAYVLAEAIIFVPLLLIANMRAEGVISSAAGVTAIGFVGLTAVAFITRKDFSFLRGVLLWGGFGVLLLIVAGVLFGFQLGTFFSVGMVVFAGAAILYDTSNVIHHYPEDRYVGASLALFSSVALMFWYVLRIFMSRD